MNKKTVLMLVVAMSVGAFTQTAVAQSAAGSSAAVEAAAVSPGPLPGGEHHKAKAAASHMYAPIVPEEESVKK